MNAVEDKLIARLFKGTLTVVMLSMIALTSTNIIDGIVTGKFLGTRAMAAFGRGDFANQTEIFRRQ